jgi:hypothetical protein
VQSVAGMEQDVHFLRTEALHLGGSGRGWLLKADWDGSVGIYFVSGTETTTNQSLCQEIGQPGWLQSTCSASLAATVQLMSP